MRLSFLRNSQSTLLATSTHFWPRSFLFYGGKGGGSGWVGRISFTLVLLSYRFQMFLNSSPEKLISFVCLF